jgi:hypothetical protein
MRTIRQLWALDCAERLDRDIDALIGTIGTLPVDQRDGPVNVAMSLLWLADCHRYYARRWITGRELSRRTDLALSEFDQLAELLSGRRRR